MSGLRFLDLVKYELKPLGVHTSIRGRTQYLLTAHSLLQALHTSPPRSRRPRNKGAIPATDNMDERHVGHLLGHEPDATIRHRLVRSANYSMWRER